MRWARARAAAAAIGMVLTVAWATSTSADVVGPPPDDCPDGTTGRSCHGGRYCAPDVCTSDADCAGGEECIVVQACIGDIVCVRRLPPGAKLEDHQRDTVEGLCPEGTACESGSCQRLSLCVAREPTPGAGRGGGDDQAGRGGGDDEGGCGCRATPSGASPGVAWLLVAAAVAIARRRLDHR